MGKIVTLGEIMLRLSTPGNTRFVQADSFDVVYGGGEANVAVSCANYGHEAYFVTKLPKHEIGQSAVNALRKYGVKTDFITRGGARGGNFYLEPVASMRARQELENANFGKFIFLRQRLQSKQEPRASWLPIMRSTAFTVTQIAGC